MKNIALASGFVGLCVALAMPAQAAHHMGGHTNDTANMGNIVPASQADEPAPITLQQKIEGPDSELLATQPGEVDLNNENMSDLPTLLAGEANYGNITPASEATEPAPITLQQRIKDKRGELVATQPGEVEIQQNRRIVAR